MPNFFLVGVQEGAKVWLNHCVAFHPSLYLTARRSLLMPGSE